MRRAGIEGTLRIMVDRVMIVEGFELASKRMTRKVSKSFARKLPQRLLPFTIDSSELGQEAIKFGYPPKVAVKKHRSCRPWVALKITPLILFLLGLK